jgi:hypothetical protein
MMTIKTDGLFGLCPGDPDRGIGGRFSLREPDFELCDPTRGPVEGIPAQTQRRREQEHDEQGGGRGGRGHKQPADGDGAHG